jgi:glycosidase
VILDGVFNHSGRHFFAFKDIQRRGPASAYRDWYAGLDFSRRSPLGDSFNYQTWAGHYGLPKFNGASPGLRSHLLDAVEFWIREFDIDGLRLDAACDLLPEFMDALAARCRSLKPDFWLMGEVVAGDYRNWAREGRLDSVTNYELYKGLWSSFNDHNFYELAWTLNRQFGAEGMYRGLGLYNFADNHDVNRIASTLKNRAHLPLLYGLLFTLPGVPSIYYGSEYGVEGARTEWSDRELRPRWDPGWEKRGNAQGGPGLCALIAALIKTREAYPALRRGGFRQLYLSHGQYAFLREGDSRPLMTLVNASDGERLITVPPGLPGGTWRDLGSGEELRASPQGLPVRMAPFSLRILCGS